jgi:hypothetical protein
MQLYRFSPILDQDQFRQALRYIHESCHKLCQQTLQQSLPAAGNIGIFCHYDQEYKFLTKVREQLTNPSIHLSHKYYQLHTPITFEATATTPSVTYEYLYIRHPDPYRSQVGDIDFYLEPAKYALLKASLLHNQDVSGVRLFERAEPDMIELCDPDIDALAYVSDVYIKDIVVKG